MTIPIDATSPELIRASLAEDSNNAILLMQAPAAVSDVTKTAHICH